MRQIVHENFFEIETIYKNNFKVKTSINSHLSLMFKKGLSDMYKSLYFSNVNITDGLYKICLSGDDELNNSYNEYKNTGIDINKIIILIDDIKKIIRQNLYDITDFISSKKKLFDIDMCNNINNQIYRYIRHNDIFCGNVSIRVINGYAFIINIK